MTDWQADARAFSRTTSKAREKRPGDEVALPSILCVHVKRYHGPLRDTP